MGQEGSTTDDQSSQGSRSAISFDAIAPSVGVPQKGVGPGSGRDSAPGPGGDTQEERSRSCRFCGEQMVLLEIFAALAENRPMLQGSAGFNQKVPVSRCPSCGAVDPRYYPSWAEADSLRAEAELTWLREVSYLAQDHLD